MRNSRRLHREEEALRAASEEAATRRADVEKAHHDTKAELERLTRERVQLAAVEAIRHAEATRLRQEAKTRHEAEVARLRNEEDAFRALAEQVGRRRAEVRAAHKQAEDEIRTTDQRTRTTGNCGSSARRGIGAHSRIKEETVRTMNSCASNSEGLQLVSQEAADSSCGSGICA